MSAVLAIPPGGPLFEGHFPGRPILPGISELVLIADAIVPGGRADEVSAIPFARFRGLVLPSDRLDVTTAPRDGGVRFEARRGAALVANGALGFGPVEPGSPGASAVAARPARGAARVETLIPHRPPMLFVERVLGEADDGATCLGRVPAECALVRAGAVPAFVALEAAAQTAAVWEALRRSRGAGEPGAKIGYLVSLKDVVLYRATIPAGADLIATARLDAAAGELATYAVDISVEGGLALKGVMGTYFGG